MTGGSRASLKSRRLPVSRGIASGPVARTVSEDHGSDALAEPLSRSAFEDHATERSAAALASPQVCCLVSTPWRRTVGRKRHLF
jgi:hypothetical protein